jgi:hypothetical protein
MSVSLGVSVLIYETPETPETVFFLSHEFLSRFSSLFA